LADTLESLAADFAAAAGLVEPASLVVVERAAAAIRDDWRAAWTFGAGTTVPYLAAAVTSEAGLLPGVGAWAEIGPDNSLEQGPLGDLLEFGSVHNAPRPGGGPAVLKETPLLVAELEATLEALTAGSPADAGPGR